MIFFKILFTLILLQTIAFAQVDELHKVKLQLQWKYQFQFAGFIMAKELGYYKDVGLDVEVLEYNNTNTIKELEENKIDYAINNSLLTYKNNKLNNITLIATYFQRSPLILITQPEIKSVLEIKGKKLMISENNRYNSSLSIMLDYFGVDAQNTTFVEPTFSMNDFIEKKIDVVTAFRSNELFILDKKNVPYNIIDPVEYGFSTNAINLFASHDKVKNNPQEIKNILSATKKGWKYALENIDEVARLIHKKYQPNKSIEHLAYEGKVTKYLMLLDLYDIGEINTNFVLKTYDRLLKNAKLDKNQTADKLMFNETSQVKSNKLTIELTHDEKRWIDKNSLVTFAGDPNWLPYEAFDKAGNHIGIVSQYLTLIEEKSGLKFKSIPVSSWSESLQTAKRGDAKIISGDAADMLLNKKFNPIESYIKNPIVIIMDIKNNYVEELESIKEKKIAIIKNYGYTADIFKTYPDIEFIEVENIQEGLNAVSEGKYDAVLASSAIASYSIAEMALNNVKIVGKTPVIMNLTLFVSKDEPILFNIINKSIKSITQEQKHKILQKWIKQRYIEKVDYTLVSQIIIFMLFVILFILFWSFKMRQEIKKRKIIQDELEKSEYRYKSLFKSNLAIQLIIDPKTQKIIESNKSAEIFYGYTHEQLLSMYISEINTMDEKEIQEEIQNAQQLNKKSFNFKHRLSSGEIRNVEVYSGPIEIENQSYLYSIIFDITQRIKAEDELKHQAKHDSLTSLPNRALFLDRLKQSIKSAQRNSKNIAVIFIDLDHFKEINDSLGHSVGDILLQSVSQKFQETIRKSDTVARIGGDEFVVLLNNFSNTDAIINIVNNLMQSLKEPLIINKQELYVSLSIGISTYPHDGIDADTLIKNADAAMYKAKHNGRNNYQFYTADMTEKAFERVTLETQLRQSIEKGQLQVYYQPQVDARDENIIGMEALIRWNHPEMGLVSPAKFIPLAEDCGFIIKLDEWVMEQAIMQFKEWYDKGFNPGILSLNLAILRLEQDNFIQRVQESIKKNDADASWLSFEVIESSIMKNPQKSIEKLNELNKSGIKLSIDDFGTGYSSLSYLKKLPIEKLKIDQSFVMDIPNDVDDMEITKTIISMAQNLNLKIIAEGVETEQQRDFLLENGCNEVQGYLYYKPSPASYIEKILKENKPKDK